MLYCTIGRPGANYILLADRKLDDIFDVKQTFEIIGLLYFGVVKFILPVSYIQD